MTILYIHGSISNCSLPPFLLYEGKFSGIISERDYIKKIALLGRKSKETKIKDIYVHSRNVMSVSVDDSVEKAMEIMMTKSIRHLPIMDGDKLVGIVSIKDLIKEVVTDREKTIRSLSDLALGKGAGAM
jgi:CBS domain-containing protein